MLLKVVSRYDLSVLSMSVIGFQKNTYMGLVCGWSEVLSFFGDFWNLFNFAKRLSNHTTVDESVILLIISHARIACFSQSLSQLCSLMRHAKLYTCRNYLLI